MAAERLRVEVALKGVDGTLTLVEPKSASGYRSLPLPQAVVGDLRAHQVQQAHERAVAGPMWEETGLVFTTRWGKPLDARNVTRQYKPKLAAANLPDMRWHDLRHSCASMLIAQEVPLTTIQVILGHSGIGITNQYAHLVPELKLTGTPYLEPRIRLESRPPTHLGGGGSDAAQSIHR